MLSSMVSFKLISPLLPSTLSSSLSYSNLICLGNDEACRITLEHPSPLRKTSVSLKRVPRALIAGQSSSISEPDMVAFCSEFSRFRVLQRFDFSFVVPPYLRGIN
uniref:Uncharacterized protein n=1 Tax=Opuntia streptacantha TaxID=393608 RepID=A0A7C9DRP0_OPUST